MTTFRGFVCWDPLEVQRIAPLTAENPSNAVFQATHVPSRLRRSDAGSQGPWSPYTEDDFLKDFLDPKRPFTFVPVVGASGSGKSHLIRWLSSNIDRRRDRHVVVIPKYQTNLRAIIEAILGGLEGQGYSEFWNRLGMAADALVPAQARNRLLSELVYFIGPENPENALTKGHTRFLVQRLPNFIGDPLISKYLTREGEVIDRFVREALEGRGAEDKSAPYAFQVKDLLLDYSDPQNINRLGYEFYEQFVSDEMLQQKTVEWLNHHLPAALRSLYGLRGNELRQLVYDLRKQLLAEGKELVLLIEDFAVLQGIQGELLDALIEDTIVEGKQVLCTLRTALAVTTGYLEGLDTVKTRASYTVDLDVPTSHDVRAYDLIDFFAGYMSAVRAGQDTIEASWSDREEAETKDWRPNPCLSCKFQNACHSAFGSTPDKRGLYPFNATAIQLMAAQAGGDTLNPRKLIRNVLSPLLEDSPGAIEAGRFPQLRLDDLFETRRLSAADRTRLSSVEPDDEAQRRERLLSLWGGTDDLVNLMPGVHEAFSMPLLPGLQELASGGQEEVLHSGSSVPTRRVEISGVSPQRLTKPVVSEAPDRPPLVKLLDAWSRGASLTQTESRKLREMVYENVSAAIDWESETLSKKYFTSENIWVVNSVEIQGWEGKQTLAPHTLRLPIPGPGSDRSSSAVALQAIVLRDHYGNWEFTGSVDYIHAFRAHLQRWSETVLAHLRPPQAGGKAEDPVPSLVEILSLGAGASGVSGALSSDLPTQVSALLTPPQANSLRSRKWQGVHNMYLKHHGNLATALLAHVALAKGIGTPRMLDLARIAPALRKAQTQAVPSQPPPTARPLQSAADIHGLLLEMPALLAEERKVLNAQYAPLAEAFGRQGDATGVAAALGKAAASAKTAAVFRPGTWSTKVDDSITKLATIPLAEIFRTTNEALAMTPDSAALRLMAQFDSSPLDQLSEMLDVFRPFLNLSLEQAELTLGMYRQGEGGIGPLEERVQAAFRSLERSLAIFTEDRQEAKA